MTNEKNKSFRDPFTALLPRAQEGQWVKDLSKQKRGLGMVKIIHQKTNGMRVFWIKSKTTSWIVYHNHGHYHAI
jgi:hypothetical protein